MTALKWIQDAVFASPARYTVDTHFYKRMGRRSVTTFDWKTATTCVAYLEGKPLADGTCWRLLGGKDVDGDDLTIGVEAYEDRGQRALLITVF